MERLETKDVVILPMLLEIEYPNKTSLYKLLESYK